jgi:hypothetical protein
MPINSQMDAARYLVKRIHEGLGTTPDETLFAQGVPQVLPLITSNLRYEVLKRLVVYVFERSKNDPLDGKKGPWTWYSNHATATDPVNCFVKNVRMIEDAAAAYVERKRQYRTAIVPNSGGYTQAQIDEMSASFREVQR